MFENFVCDFKAPPSIVIEGVNKLLEQHDLRLVETGEGENFTVYVEKT